MSFLTAPKARQQGFILAATLWLIAFIAVAAGFLGQWAEQARQQIADQQHDLQAELDFQGTLATLLYLANTQYVNEYGIILNDPSVKEKEAALFGDIQFDTSNGRVIKLHDQAYQGMGESIFSVQDENGLIACNTTELFQLQFLLGVFGLEAQARDDAIAKLQDYQDPDNFHRINGAETQQYQQQHKPAPANRLLLTSWELRNVLSWDQYPQLWRSGLPRLTSSSWLSGFNFNTAPSLVLQTTLGISHDDAEKIIQARNQTPLLSVEQIAQIIGRGVNFDIFSLTTRPSNFLRISLWHPQTGRLREVHIELHPPISTKDYALTTTRPWRVDYQLDITKTAESQNAQPKPLQTELFSYKNPESR